MPLMHKWISDKLILLLLLYSFINGVLKKIRYKDVTLQKLFSLTVGNASCLK